jgi:hypothetical protein
MLFKVPRHHFEQNSKVFQDSFCTSATGKSVVKQFTDDQAIQHIKIGFLINAENNVP